MLNTSYVSYRELWFDNQWCTQSNTMVYYETIKMEDPYLKMVLNFLITKYIRGLPRYIASL
jgi:hypothetical protein